MHISVITQYWICEKERERVSDTHKHTHKMMQKMSDVASVTSHLVLPAIDKANAS